jgi:hypothetical protein
MTTTRWTRKLGGDICSRCRKTRNGKDKCCGLLPVGTKSLLFGVHQFFLHWIFVARAWIKLYGWTWDVRVWTCFLLHDIGYWGKRDMNGAEGERHVELGAKVVGWLFDDSRCKDCGIRYHDYCTNRRWHDFSLFHSRHYAQTHEAQPSKLCVADKFATCMYPPKLYIFLASLSGEIDEYMSQSRGNSDELELAKCQTKQSWFYELQLWALQWTARHKDLY